MDTIKKDFYVLSQDEIESVDGGSVGGALVGVCAGAIGIITGPPAMITGTVAVGLWYAGSALIAAGGIASGIGE